MNIDFQEVSPEEWNEHAADISFASFGREDQSADCFIKVPFKSALSLVARR
jgi:DNA primase large subunit